LALLKTTGRKFSLILIELAFLYLIGVSAHFLTRMPADAMIWGSVAVTGLYFGVNLAQKHKEIGNEQSDEVCE